MVIEYEPTQISEMEKSIANDEKVVPESVRIIPPLKIREGYRIACTERK